MKLDLAIKVFALVAIVVGVSMWIGYAKTKAEPAPQLERVKEWAYVAQTKQLTLTEELSLVVIPSEFGSPLDVKCFIYRNREFNQATLMCPGASQDDISLPELDRAR